jgi:hypothetical protein
MLTCHKECLGEIVAPSGPAREQGWFYEDDEVGCPLCGTQYTVAMTDAFEEPVPYLVEKAP